MKYCKPELSFFIFTSYERSECFIFGVKRKMLHSRMKWSCFIVRRFLWSILRRCRKIWSASCDAWSGTACHEAKPDGFIPPFFWQKKWRRKFLSSPAILNCVLSLKLQNFAVKWISENRFTFSQKNSESPQLCHQDCNRIKTMIHRIIYISTYIRKFESKDWVSGRRTPPRRKRTSGQWRCRSGISLFIKINKGILHLHFPTPHIENRFNG